MKIVNECRVELVDFMGDDLTVVNSARVSFDKASGWVIPQGTEYGESITLSEKDTKLINYLAKHNHYTPFTHCIVTMRETVPVFVARQRFKHVVGFSYNEVSRRYVDEEPEFFVPDEWRGKAKNAKQGSDGEVEFKAIHYPGDGAFKADQWYSHFMEEASDLYNALLSEGVAPEQARIVLPQSMMTSYYVTGSLAAWARAYKLRSEETAQKEIRDLAAKWDEIIRPLFPVSWEAVCASS